MSLFLCITSLCLVVSSLDKVCHCQSVNYCYRIQPARKEKNKIEKKKKKWMDLKAVIVDVVDGYDN